LGDPDTATASTLPVKPPLPAIPQIINPCDQPLVLCTKDKTGLAARRDRMTEMKALKWETVAGGDRAVAWFGREPHFHDANILEFHFDVLEGGCNGWVGLIVDSLEPDTRDHRRSSLVRLKFSNVSKYSFASGFASSSVLEEALLFEAESGIHVHFYGTTDCDAFVEAKTVAIYMVPFA
jgi:hypothetical protein